MTRRTVLTLALLAAALYAFGDFAATVEEAERLNDEERHVELQKLLETALGSEKDSRNRAELYWRLSRALMYQGDAAAREGAGEAELLPYFEKGQELAQMAIDADPTNFQGYFWKSGNAGRWGQTKGVLKALAKAKEMRVLLSKAVELNPVDKGSYYVLGQLYHEVPGWPLGFGNIEFAVSLGRRGVDLMVEEVRTGVEETEDFDYYTELAKHLWSRNWDQAKRTKVAADNRARMQAATDNLTRFSYYESSVTLPAMSDREEARQLAQRAVSGLEGIARRKLSEEDDLKEARDTLASFK